MVKLGTLLQQIDITSLLEIYKKIYGLKVESHMGAGWVICKRLRIKPQNVPRTKFKVEAKLCATHRFHIGSWKSSTAARLSSF